MAIDLESSKPNFLFLARCLINYQLTYSKPLAWRGFTRSSFGWCLSMAEARFKLM